MAGLVTALSSLLIAIPSFRIKSYYMIIASFGFQMVISNVLTNWIALTRGPAGLSGIPPLGIGGLSFGDKSSAFFVALVITVLSILIFYYLVKSPFARVVESVREDEIGAQSLGKSVPRVKSVVFMIGSGFAGMAGSLFAHYSGFISPDSFTLAESFFIMTIVLIGGAGTLYGPVLGAVIMVSLPEILRFFGMSDVSGAAMRQIIIAVILIILLRFNAQGLAGLMKDITQNWQLRRGRT